MRHRPDDALSGRLYRTSNYPEDNMTDPVVVTDEPTASTPEPVVKAGWIWGTLVTFIVSVIGVLVAVGKITQAEADSINAGLTDIGGTLPTLVGSIVGIVGIVSGMVSHIATTAVARRHVRPVAPQAVRR